MGFFKHFSTFSKRINLNVLLFLLPILLLGLLNAINDNKPQVSQIENRKLKSMPQFSLSALASGKFIKEYEDYYSDTFILREKIVKISRDIKKLKGISLEDDVSITSVSREKEISSVEIPSTVSLVQETNGISNQEQTKTVAKDNVEVLKNGAKGVTPEKIEDDNQIVNKYLILGDSAIEVHNYNENAYSHYAQALNTFKDHVGDSIKVYSILIPTTYEFIKNEKYKKLGDPESLGINKVNNSLRESIIKVNAYDSLKENSDKYIYFRTDMHWTGLGAYYAYTAFMEAQEEQPVSLDKYEEGKIDGYLGTLYGATLNKKLFDNPDTIYYYKPFVQNQFYAYPNGKKNSRKIIDFDAAELYDKYCLFLGGLRSRGEIFSSVNNGRKLLVIKDSYGNAFIPFLIPHYEEIYIVDPRACDINVKNFIKDKGIKEVLFINYVFSVTNEGFPGLILKLAH